MVKPENLELIQNQKSLNIFENCIDKEVEKEYNTRESEMIQSKEAEARNKYLAEEQRRKEKQNKKWKDLRKEKLNDWRKTLNSRE